MKQLKKLYFTLTSTRAGGVYILLFAFLIGLATFVENDFGTSTAQKLIFKTHWFEGLLFLFGLSIFQNIFTFRMIQRRKWFMFLFHAAILIILLGAAITRYTGTEGSMHIREQDSSNIIQSRESYLNFKVENQGKRYEFHLPVLFASIGNNHYYKKYMLGNLPFEVEVTGFVPNPAEELQEDPEGSPVLWLVRAGRNGRENYFLPWKSSKEIGNMQFSFGAPSPSDAVQFDYKNDTLFFRSSGTYTRMTMATRALDTVYPNIWYPAKLRSLHSGNGVNFVIKDFNTKAKIHQYSEGKKLNGTDPGAVSLKITTPDGSKELTVIGAASYNGTPAISAIGPLNFSVNYGPRSIVLPFSLALTDFRLKKYPGTERPASYESDVILIDPRKNTKKPYSIYMNHILDYDGYRFFQSSYDQDELGTILSVNHDWWGTWVTYIGYILFTIGLLAMFFTGVSRFSKLSKQID